MSISITCNRYLDIIEDHKHKTDDFSESRVCRAIDILHQLLKGHKCLDLDPELKTKIEETLKNFSKL